jgi:hypothetical protein
MHSIDPPKRPSGVLSLLFILPFLKQRSVPQKTEKDVVGCINTERTRLFRPPVSVDHNFLGKDPLAKSNLSQVPTLF